MYGFSSVQSAMVLSRPLISIPVRHECATNLRHVQLSGVARFCATDAIRSTDLPSMVRPLGYGRVMRMSRSDGDLKLSGSGLSVGYRHSSTPLALGLPARRSLLHSSTSLQSLRSLSTTAIDDSGRYLLDVTEQAPTKSRFTELLQPLLSSVDGPVKYLRVLVHDYPDYNIVKKAAEFDARCSDDFKMLSSEQQKQAVALLSTSGIDKSSLLKMADKLSQGSSEGFREDYEIFTVVDAQSERPLGATLFSRKDRMIYALAVDSGHRKHGLGSFLFSVAVDSIRKEPMDAAHLAAQRPAGRKPHMIWFSTDRGRPSAIHIYRCAGAVEYMEKSEVCDLDDMFKDLTWEDLLGERPRAAETVEFELDPGSVLCQRFLDRHLSFG